MDEKTTRFKRRVAKQREEFQKQQEQEYLKLFSDFNAVFASEEGKRVLQWIMTECGYQESESVLNSETKEIAALSTIHNSALRSFYLRMRRFIKPDILIDVEIMGTDDLIE